MKIVIDIPEEDYNFVRKQVADGITNPLKVCIANGTPFEITEEQAIDKLHETGWLIKHDKEMTDRPQKVVTIPHELIEKLVLCVVDTVEKIDWDKAIEAYKERPTGKWINHEDGYNICPLCKYKTAFSYNFCPNCGAKMDGGES